MYLRFHWRLPPGGERPDVLLPASTDRPKVGLPDLAARVEFCRRAEEMGIDSVLTAFAANMPDPMLLAAALAPETEKIKFIVAYRPGLMSPVLFVQQVNTLSTLADGRVSLNIVIGHSQKEQAGYGDFLTHDERYDRAEEFLAICNALWNGGSPFTFEGRHYRVQNAQLNTPFSSERLSRPEIFLGGGSPQAQALASRQASCWLSLGESPKALGSRMKSAREQGVEVGLRFSIIARPTRSEALEAAASLINGADTQWARKWFVDGADSSSIKALFAEEPGSDWLTPYLWKGAVATHGASAVALIGSPEDIATAIMEYKQLGATQFILSGWPNLEAVTYFGDEILPLIRIKERVVTLAAEGASAAD